MHKRWGYWRTSCHTSTCRLMRFVSGRTLNARFTHHLTIFTHSSFGEFGRGPGRRRAVIIF